MEVNMRSFPERMFHSAMMRQAALLIAPGIVALSLLACGGSKQVAQTEAEEPVVAQPAPEPPPREETVAAAPVERAAPAPLALQNVNFDYAKGLREHPEAQILIEGHCDERGTVEYNLALGDRRAKAVKDYLVALGIDSSRLSTISYGKERPLDDGHNESAWAKNRRAEFVRK
jgi:peptidoglycan-associated lipoprotein